MLARMNFASQLATNQRVALREAARPYAASPDQLVDFTLDTLSVREVDAAVRNTLIAYVQAGGIWTGSDTQLLAKAAGLFHLVGASGDYQFV